MKDKSICGIPPITRFDLCDKRRMPISSEMPIRRFQIPNAAHTMRPMLINLSYYW